MTSLSSLDYDPLSPRWRENPYPIYRRLRDEAPVYLSEASRTWCVSRYDDVQHVLESPELFSSRAMFTFLMMRGEENPPLFDWGTLHFLVRFALTARTHPFAFNKARSLISEDGAVHTALRGIVNRGFTPRRIQAWEPRVRELVADCMAKLRSGEPFDLVHDLAIPLPVTLISEMLGVEPERRADFKRWYRDERRFEDPDRFDVTRNPQGHVGFGFGKHFCLGASLARLEAGVALEAIAPELGGLRRAAPQTSHIDSFLVRGPSRLELARA